ncbi:UNVERIFIED_CONTAM: Nsun5 [Trichonephila clavipes]
MLFKFELYDSKKIYAFEKNSSRYQTLREMLDRAPVKICEAYCMDFYSVDAMDPKYNSVEYILVDPTCSGSGMVNRMDSVTDTRDSKTAFRLQKLAGFQILLLKHALSFPSVKRVVYSTCSMSEEENEYVVQEVLESFKHIFKLVRVMPNWPIRGMEEYKFGKFCLRANPENTLTNGFFVAMFERMTSEEIERLSRDEWFFKDKWSKKKNKRQENWWPKDDYNDSDVLSEAFGSGSTIDVENSTSTVTNESSSSHVSLKKRKKVRRASRELTDSSEVSNQTDYWSSASIVSSEIYSSDDPVKAISTISKDGECSRKNIHANKFLNNGSENNKQNESFSKTKGNCDDNKSSTEVCPAESSKTKSNEEDINNCSSSNSDKLSRKKKKQKHSFVKEESCNSEIQNEFHRKDMNIPDVESNSHNSGKKKKGSNNQEIQDRILSDDNPNSKVRADNLSGSCSKFDFNHELEEIDQSRNQCESSIIKAKKENKKKHDVRQNLGNPETLAASEQTKDAPKKKSKKKHMSSESTESGESVSKTASFTELQDIPRKKHKKKHHASSEITDSGENVNEIVSCTEQTIEPQDTPGKKRKKRHNTSTESTEMGENVCESVSHIEETLLKKKHKKKCKDKKNKE